MSYAIFEELCRKIGVKPADVARETGVSTATLSNWKAGRYTPKADKRRLIADYLGVSLEVLDGVETDAQDGYYLSQETARKAQELFEDKHMRILFDAARGASPEDLEMAADLLRRLKATNPDG